MLSILILQSVAVSLDDYDMCFSSNRVCVIFKDNTRGEKLLCEVEGQQKGEDCQDNSNRYYINTAHNLSLCSSLGYMYMKSAPKIVVMSMVSRTKSSTVRQSGIGSG